MQNDGLGEVIETLSELKRLHQLNIELLEQLSVSCSWLMEQRIPIPNAEKIVSLLSKAQSLIREIQSEEPKVLQYSVIRRKVTDGKSDEEVPEPLSGFCVVFV